MAVENRFGQPTRRISKLRDGAGGLQAEWLQVPALGASLVAISPRLAQYERFVRRRAKLELDVLTDRPLRGAEAFRLAFLLPCELKQLYAAQQHSRQVSQRTGFSPADASPIRRRPRRTDPRGRIQWRNQTRHER